jgi:hypothetical protein
MVGEVLSLVQMSLSSMNCGQKQWGVLVSWEGYGVACQEEVHKESLKGLWTHQHCLHPPQIEEWE